MVSVRLLQGVYFIGPLYFTMLTGHYISISFALGLIKLIVKVKNLSHTLNYVFLTELDMFYMILKWQDEWHTLSLMLSLLNLSVMPVTSSANKQHLSFPVAVQQCRLCLYLTKRSSKCEHSASWQLDVRGQYTGWIMFIVTDLQHIFRTRWFLTCCPPGRSLAYSLHHTAPAGHSESLPWFLSADIVWQL